MTSYITNLGLNRITALIQADIYHGKMGTDNTAPNTTQTDLVAGVAATDLATTESRTGNNITVTYQLSNAVGTGNSYKEIKWTVNSSSETMLVRNIIPSYSHTTSKNLTILKQFRIRAV